MTDAILPRGRLDALRGALAAEHRETEFRPPPEVGEAAKDPDRRVGRFVCVERIGVGASGDVWRAWDGSLRRWVALKVLTAASEPELRARFLREAHTSARLRHPNIVSIHDAGEDDRGRAYIAMDWVRGGPIRAAELPQRATLEAMREIALALEHAHSQGVVHRDLKPSNVLWDGARAYLADFGLARELEAPRRRTITGLVLGTPEYMAPEQAEGRKDVGPAADVYGLGATLYHLLTNRPPFGAEQVFELLRRVITDDPVPPRRWNERVSRDLEAVVLKCLEKDPRRRYASAAAVARELERVLAGEPVEACAVNPVTRWLRETRRKPARLTVAAMTAALVVALGGWVIADAAYRSLALDRAKEDARAAEARGDWEAGREALRRAERLAPRDPEVRLLREKLERRASAARALGVARARIASLAALDTELAQLRAEKDAMAVEEWEPVERKLPLWILEARIEKKERQRVALVDAILAGLSDARGLDTTSWEIRGELLAFLKSLYDEQPSETLRGEIVALHPGWTPPDSPAYGIASVTTIPPGGQLTFLHVEEGEDRRWSVRPWIRRERLPGGGVEIWLSGSVSFPPGNEHSYPEGAYGTLLQLEGFRDVRLSVLIRADRLLDLAIPLFTDAEIGEGFVYVPPGPHIGGGGPHPELSSPAGERDVAGFFIAVHEVTMGEYREFVEALAREDVGFAWARIPQGPNGYLWGITAEGTVEYGPPAMTDRWPALAVSWEDAMAYIAWRSRRDGREYRLPTEEEWEKAARGADGRPYPWGSYFDWAFTNGALSHRDGATPVDVGTFEYDESPYGIRDMGGNVYEWCADVLEGGATRPVRGGCWSASDPTEFHMASRAHFSPSRRFMSTGFRLARSCPK